MSLDWSFPWPAQRMPVLADAIVSTSQPLATAAGVSVLRAGGSAMDAAVAAAITLTVVEPTSNGIGSDLFAMVWDGALHGFNGSGRSPAGLDADRFLGSAGMPLTGWAPVTVPGAVDGWCALTGRFGRIPFSKVVAPAIERAERGFPVSPRTAQSWARAAGRWGGFPAFSQTFLPGGRAPCAGERVRFPDHAQTLHEIAETRGESFYRGRLASRIASCARADSAAMTEADLGAHRGAWVAPMQIDVGPCTVHELPPNGQGIAALLALGLLRALPGPDPADCDPDAPQSLHRQIEAMKLAFLHVYREVADPRRMTGDPAWLLEPGFLAEEAARLRDDEAQDFGWRGPAYGGTVLVVAADASGMMVSLIQSNYTGFGSGIVIPGTGIAMQNRGACFTTERGHPNAVAPGVRPFHTIIPAFVTRRTGSGAEPVMAFGVMGGPMQPQGHVQVLLRTLHRGGNPQAALDAPRWQVTGGRRVRLEPGFSAVAIDHLRRLGHEVEIAGERSVQFGSGQAVMQLADRVMVGASDGRLDGQAGCP